MARNYDYTPHGGTKEHIPFVVRKWSTHLPPCWGVTTVAVPSRGLLSKGMGVPDGTPMLE